MDVFVNVTDAGSGAIGAAGFSWAQPSDGSLDFIQLVRDGHFGAPAKDDDIYIDTTGATDSPAPELSNNKN